jgi:KaiC/GvpD/RAD55 family RecA-like ATPase
LAENLGGYAVTYARLGFEVFPADPVTKSPRVSQYSATTDVEQVRAWWAKEPDSLIAHRVNAETIILDVDPRHNGHETWKLLEKRFDLPEPSRVHFSGRLDGGCHVWYEAPDSDRLTVKELDAWAKENGVGCDVKGRWTSGVDLIQHNHRYTILPPSPHAKTGAPYYWGEGRSHTAPLSPTPGPLVPFVTAKPVEPSTDFHTVDADSIADWYSQNHGFAEQLEPAGWSCVSGSGDDDGSEWRHPEATSAVSATVTNGCLFVYSTSTVFEPTEPGNPVGYTPFRVYATLHHGGDMSRAAAEARKMRPATSTPADARKPGDGHTTANPSMFVDWPTFWVAEREEDEWLYDDVLSRGRGHAIYARGGTGKSLFVLWVALQVALRGDVDVIYLDYEMTEGDLFERLSDMGCGPDTDLSALHYALLPMVAPLDTEAGRADLLELVGRMERPHVLVVIDTNSRATQGPENDNDTTRDFYRHTGMALKAAGCTWVRIDHSGKDKEKGQRGGSAKSDDVDIVWRLEAAEGRTVVLKREKARMGWVKEAVSFEQMDEPLRYKGAPTTYTAEAIRIARELDRLEIPTEWSLSKAAGAARREGVTGSQKYFAEAVRLRRDPSRWPPKTDRYEPLRPGVSRHVSVICPDDVPPDVSDDEDGL